jgi:hypothetical protein
MFLNPAAAQASLAAVARICCILNGCPPARRLPRESPRRPCHRHRCQSVRRDRWFEVVRIRSRDRRGPRSSRADRGAQVLPPAGATVPPWLPAKRAERMEALENLNADFRRAGFEEWGPPEAMRSRRELDVMWSVSDRGTAGAFRSSRTGRGAQVLPLGGVTVPPWLPAKSARVSNLPACCALGPPASAAPYSCRHEPCIARSAWPPRGMAGPFAWIEPRSEERRSP